MDGPGPGLARAYYRHIDEGAYDALGDLLAASFRHDRPDRIIEGRESFVRFMREERPVTDTTHAVDGVYVNGSSVAASGRLLDADGTTLFEFVDVFAVEDGSLASLRTHVLTSPRERSDPTG